MKVYFIRWGRWIEDGHSDKVATDAEGIIDIVMADGQFGWMKSIESVKVDLNKKEVYCTYRSSTDKLAINTYYLQVLQVV